MAKFTGTDAAISVLMVSPQFHPIVGGYERAAERLSAALAEAGSRVVVITERRTSTWPASEVIDGFEVRRLSCWHVRYLHRVSSLLSFAFFLLRYGCEFDVWHVHQYGMHAALAVVLGKLLRRPVALKLTSSKGMGIESAMGSGIGGRVMGFFHRRVSACLAVSEETHVEAIHFGIPPERIHLIPNGVDGRQFYPASPEQKVAARRALGLVCERLVLFVGRLSSEKNALGLLDAWAAIDTATREGVVLALVGDGPDWDAVSAKSVSAGLAGSVLLAGNRSDVATWYRAADLYVISSDREGLSNTMLEAMATGLPVVSTRVSGSGALLESPTAGVVVDVSDMTQLAGAINTLLQNQSLRAQLGKNARLRFESRFSLANTARQTMALYGKLLHQPARKGRS